MTYSSHWDRQLIFMTGGQTLEGATLQDVWSDHPIHGRQPPLQALSLAASLSLPHRRLTLPHVYSA
jgi:hypothetical protein